MSQKLAANLIRLMGWGFIIFGVIFVTIAFAGYDGLAQAMVPLFDWTGAPRLDSLSRDAKWYAAIMSGLSAGFGAFYVFLVAPMLTWPDVSVQKLAKRGGLIAAIIWYIVDSIGSLGASVPSNVATNTLFLIGFLIPLLSVKFEKA